MGTYLKLFNNHSQYETFIGGGGDTPFVRPNVSHCIEQNHVHYNPYDYSDRYLTFVALEDGATFTFNGTTVNDVLNKASYSTDNGETWTEIASGVSTPPIDSGERILWKGEMTPGHSFRSYGIGAFTSTKMYNVEGNIMSLLYDDEFEGQVSLEGKDYAFIGLFYNESNIVNAKNLCLLATTLEDSCYSQMFTNCTSLISTPKLPSLVMKPNCYLDMFNGCTSLTTAPELPATTLADSCYEGMFGNTDIRFAPILPAATLAEYCYSSMFSGCQNLISVTCLATDISAPYCTSSWLNRVATSGTFTKAASMTSWTEGASGIPSGWTIVNAN